MVNFMKLEESDVTEVTLGALINLLKLSGYDLNLILANYERKIVDNKLTGANPHYKMASVELLKELIDEANNNSVLN